MRMHHINPLQHLIGEKQGGSQAEPVPAFREELFQRWAEQVQDHRQMIAIGTKVVNATNAVIVRQLPIDFAPAC